MGTRARSRPDVHSDAQSVRFTSYALRKTGLVRSQTFLKIEEHVLLCVPYKLSVRQAVVLAVLSPRELAFFQRFRRCFCSLSLAFQRGGGRAVAQVLRGSLDGMGPVKGRPNVCTIRLSLASAPGGLREILEAYSSAYEGLKSHYGHFAGKAISLDTPGAPIEPGVRAAMLSAGGMKTSVTLLSMAVDSMEVRLNDPLPGLRVGTDCALSMCFRGSAFTVDGCVTSVHAGSNFERERVALALGFTPEIIEIVDDCVFRQSIRTAKKAV